MNPNLLVKSFERVMKSGYQVWADFYACLFALNPDIKPLFNHVGIDAQYKMMTSAVTYLVLNSSKDDIPHTGYFNKIILLHSELKIPDPFYDCWKRALITTISIYDPEYNDEIRRQWEFSICRFLQHFRV